jgi:hypothetical protein
MMDHAKLVGNYLLWNKRLYRALPPRDVYEEAHRMGLLRRLETGTLVVIGLQKKLIRPGPAKQGVDSEKLAYFINHWPNDRPYLPPSFVESVPPLEPDYQRVFVRDTIHSVRAVRFSKACLSALMKHMMAKRNERQAA